MARRGPLRASIDAATAPVAAILLTVLSAAHAADFPSKPSRIVVPYAPGGGNDLIARLLAPRLQEKLGQPFIVENRPGAGGNTGTEAVARGEADGHTTVIAANFLVMTSLFHRQPNYTLADFAAIAKVATQPVVVAVNAKSQVNTLGYLVTAGRRRDGGKDLSYGTPGIGSPHQFFIEQFARKVGIPVLHVPYSGTALAVADLVASRIDFAFGSDTTFGGQAAAGQLRVLAVLDERRLASMPSVPTAAEAGVPGVKAGFWYGIFAPARTPAPVLTLLNRTYNEVLGEPDIRAQLVKRGFIPSEPKDPAGFMNELRAEFAEWDQLARAGLKVGDK